MNVSVSLCLVGVFAVGSIIMVDNTMNRVPPHHLGASNRGRSTCIEIRCRKYGRLRFPILSHVFVVLLDGMQTRISSLK